ncbi:MAG: chromosomal replication initiator protein DnaA [Planctomycetota bacterium]|nr:chromosomal replication initiator protein DnaA [Planctomycetota bacterium]
MAKPDRAVWQDVLWHLRQNHPDTCRQWFEDIQPIGIEGGVFQAYVDQSVRQRYLQRQCAAQFTEALQAVTGKLLSVRFLGPDDGAALHTNAPRPPAGSSAAGSNGQVHAETTGGEVRPADRSGGIRQGGLLISPDYTFDNFIVGPENRLAHAAALAVCASPGRTYNPLFVHGGVGLGKTHLLQAVCQRLISASPEMAIYYVSCEQFMTQFMEAVQAGEMNDFRHRFRDVDVLLIDDIHFLAKRDRTQDEFFHTFNSLYQGQKQIILSSDAPPTDIPDLEARLVSRFQCGLVVQMNPPCYETRVQIVKQKGRIRGLNVPEEAACYVAQHVSSNIRELEGAVVKIHSLSVADGEAVSLDLARRALESDSPSVRPEVSINNIIEAVINYYSVKLTDLQSKRRQKSIAHPRQVCMWLARKHTRYSLEEIGGYFGGRDHTTVMHALKAINRRRQTDADFGRVLDALDDRVKAAGNGPSGVTRAPSA